MDQAQALTKVKLTKYFKIVSPKQKDKILFEKSGVQDKTAVPFLGRSSANNGIVDYVGPEPDFINEGNVLSIALDGSTGSTFYQYHDFASGQNIWLLVPNAGYLKDGLTPDLALYFVTGIRKAVESFTYNLSLTKTRLSDVEIFLPLNADETIDVDSIRARMGTLRNINLLEKISAVRL